MGAWNVLCTTTKCVVMICTTTSFLQAVDDGGLTERSANFSGCIYCSVSINSHILSLGKVSLDSDVHVCVSFVAGSWGDENNNTFFVAYMVHHSLHSKWVTISAFRYATKMTSLGKQYVDWTGDLISFVVKIAFIHSLKLSCISNLDVAWSEWVLLVTPMKLVGLGRKGKALIRIIHWKPMHLYACCIKLISNSHLEDASWKRMCPSWLFP